MIWYLLYPFRATTEAPVLAPTHPIRHQLSRYGSYAANHVVTTLLVSVAVATMLIYPIPFLFTTDFINGASNMPHHAWTVAQPLPYGATIHPDVMMRSIWVHSSYMQALDKTLLTCALDLQDELLGSTEGFNPSRGRSEDRLIPQDPTVDLSPRQRDAFHAINGLTNQSWFFHSPLQYWDCSREHILADPDTLRTVNDKKGQSTSVNVTLRHSIVFSGKRFEDRCLTAADALVITLVYLRDSPVGKQWERKAATLPEKIADKWDIYPPDGRSSASQLYEFHFRPISRQDSALLAIAYSLTAVYFFLSLSKIRSIKPKYGLILTVVSQIAFCMMSSFTICAIFRVDLSRIPRAAYPLVVLTMSLENIFRLINAVILTPSQDSTSSRIGYAFGETAYTAIASSVQNVILLMGLSRWVSPGVSAFCIFAAIAIIFDLFYLSTFFLAVLSVDVRRAELSDALTKASMRHNRAASDIRPRSTWERIVYGKVTLSTRIAGTIVMLGFVLIAQWHFSEKDTVFHVLSRLLRGSQFLDAASLEKSSLDKIHQARSPRSWLRMQDHETAHEIISIIKPTAHSYVARVYEPVVFVMKGSDRMPGSREPTLLPAAYDFINHQLTRFLVITVVILAAVRLLTNYLLWEEDAEDDEPHDTDGDALLSVSSFRRGHKLDVVMLAATPDGHVISVGLDRAIHIWDIRPGGINYALFDSEKPNEAPFPVLAIATDDCSTWLAILSSYKAVLWNLKERKWGPQLPVDIYGQKPEAFFFNPPDESEAIPSLVLVRRNGTLTEYAPEICEAEDFGICRSPLICVRPLFEPSKSIHTPTVCCQALISVGKPSSPGRVALVTASRRGCVHAALRESARWKSHGVELESLRDDDIHQVVPLPFLGLYLIAGVNRVHLVNLKDDDLIHTFETERMAPRSLQCSHSPQQATQSGSSGLAWFTFCYSEAESGDCIIQTCVPREEGDLIWFNSSVSPTRGGWCSWEHVHEVRRHVENPGTWNVLSDGSVIGVRQKSRQNQVIVSEERQRTEGLRHRSPRKETSRDGFGRWEVWTVFQAGRATMDESRPLFQAGDKRGHLIVSELGPMIRVGQKTVAFSFGNVVKIVTVGGHERFEDETGDQSREYLKTGSRRRKALGIRPRAWS
ncbi:sterol-sensing domain of SREBP cleavage-activation-domain-containing protein [Mariannaea sp. PMI_226]|nr:sterol-sensing domain of SREBP cleavage-activation-domain-containing protein [Mariannaea sp. PMI_226]